MSEEEFFVRDGIRYVVPREIREGWAFTDKGTFPIKTDHVGIRYIKVRKDYSDEVDSWILDEN